MDLHGRSRQRGPGLEGMSAMKRGITLCILILLATGMLLVQVAFGAIAGAKDGYVTSAHARYTAELLREGSRSVIRIKGAGEKVAVPAGTYRLVAYSVSATHQGKEWRINGGLGPRGPKVEVRPGAVTPLKFGPPLTAKVSAKKTGDAVTFSFALTDSDGKAVSTGSISAGGRRIGPPKIEIRNAEGKVVTTGEFRYG